MFNEVVSKSKSDGQFEEIVDLDRQGKEAQFIFLHPLLRASPRMFALPLDTTQNIFTRMQVYKVLFFSAYCSKTITVVVVGGIVR